MRKLSFMLSSLLFLACMPALMSQTSRVYQVGKTKVEVTDWLNKPGDAVFVNLFNGKRTYKLSMKGKQIVGDIELPNRKDPLYGKLTYSGSLLKKSNVSNKPIGLTAKGMLLVNGNELIGYTIHHSAPNETEGITTFGIIRWRLDLSTGKVSEVLNDEVVVADPKDFVLAKRALYVRQGPLSGQPGDASRFYGYLLENNILSRQWEDLAIMSIPRMTASGFNAHEVKRYLLYKDHFVQIAAQKEAATCEAMVFDYSLKESQRYYPALLVYQNHERMPSVPLETGASLVEQYRKGKGRTPDKLFSRMILVPSQDIAGLYGVLQENGSVNFPDGSLGLAPVLTEEKVAESKTGETYLLAHYFIVAYPGQDENRMTFAVAGPDGRLSFGSAENPVWTNWTIYNSEAVAENNSYTHIHSELLVGQIPDGNWQCYLASRYLNGFSQYENLNYYFPTPIGIANKNQAEAILSAEIALVRLDSIVGKRKEAAMAAYQASIRLRLEEQHAKREAQYQEWLRTRPAPAPAGGGRFTSQWKGFTYTPQTTARYNQTVQSSSFNNQMRQYNSYLNSRIYRSY